MQRLNKYEECMICGELPCACNGKPTVKKSKPEPLTGSVLDNAGDFHVNKSDRDFDMVNALAAVYPLLSPASQRAAEVQIYPPPTSDVDKRLIAFKEGRCSTTT